MKVQSHNDEIELSDDRVIIRRHPGDGAPPEEKVLLLRNIVAVDFHLGGVLSPGWVVFSCAGEHIFHGGFLEATQHPGCFVFNRYLNSQMTAFHQALADERAMLMLPSDPSLVDQLARLSDLRERGLLSESEFASAKNRLLA